MQAFDARAIERCHVPGIVLMENAGRGAFERLVRRLHSPSKLLVVCGPGNNGGDGFVVARHARNAGFAVEVVLLGSIERLTGDARSNVEAWVALGGAVQECQTADAAFRARLANAGVVIDALFGTGLARPIDGALATVIETINAAHRRVFSLDIPSGLDANTGTVLGACIRAEATFTFGHLKLGLLGGNALRHTGDVEVVGIGVPDSLIDASGVSAYCPEETDIATELDALAAPAHKGEAGKVCVIAGTHETLGAARLCAHGALRAGAGLVKVATFSPAAEALQASNWEVMASVLDPDDPWASLEPLSEWADAFVVGPGFGVSDRERRVTAELLSRVKLPVVLDADGLTHFAGRAQELKACAKLLITPHPAEAARLLSVSVDEIEANRFEALRRLVEATSATVLLKGPHTLVGSAAFADGLPRINTTGSPALATGGTGDVLSGALGALCCRMPIHEAAVCGAWLHGRAAERLGKGGAPRRGVLAREVADALPDVVMDLLQPRA